MEYDNEDNEDNEDFRDWILLKWKKECNINDHKLDAEALRTIKLHSEYLTHLQRAKRELRNVQKSAAKIIFLREQWYDGKLSKETMDELGWKYDPYSSHLVKTIAQKTKYQNADEVLLEQKELIESWKDTVDAIEKMLSHISFRTNTIKAAIDFQKMLNGG